MKAITISQPFASLIASGQKFVENRTWPTNYRGPIAIHAGKGLQYLDKDELKAYPHGCIIAVAELTECVTKSKISLAMRADIGHMKAQCSNKSWAQLHRHKHTEGPWCWIIENVKTIQPVAIRGAQGIWNWEPSEPIVYVEMTLEQLGLT